MKLYRSKLKAAADRQQYWLYVLRRARIVEVTESAFNQMVSLSGRKMGEVRVAFAFFKYFEALASADRIQSVLTRLEGGFEPISMQRERLMARLLRDLEYIGCSHHDWEEMLDCSLEIAHSSHLLGADGVLDATNQRAVEDSESALEMILDRSSLLINLLNLASATRILRVEYVRVEEGIQRQLHAIQPELREAFEKFSGSRLPAHYRNFLNYQANPTWLFNESREDQAFSQLWRPYMKQIEERKEMIEDAILSQLPEAAGDLPDLPGIAGRLQEALDNFRDYGDLVDEIVGADWQHNAPHADALIGASEPINVIPSNGVEGPCRRVLLALAKGRGRRQGSFESVLRAVRGQLINCDCTRFVIFLTDRWAPDEFEEHRQDFEAHIRRGLVFIPILVTGETLNALSL